MIKVVTSQPPALATIDGQRYIMPLWKKVPEETSLSDIHWTRPVSEKETVSILTEEFVTGSKGDEYLVKIFSDGTATCECWGHRRHKKDCKHIKALRS